MSTPRSSAVSPPGGRVASEAREGTGAGGVGVLVAFEDEHRLYALTIARAIRALRPCAAVTTTEPAMLETVVPRLAPDLVFSSAADPLGPERALAWFELPTEPSRPANMRIGARRTTLHNPGLEALLSAVDEAGRHARTERREVSRVGRR